LHQYRSRHYTHAERGAKSGITDVPVPATIRLPESLRIGDLPLASRVSSGFPSTGVFLGSQRLPQLSVFGGCCGTDHHHIDEVSTALCPVAM